MMNNSKYGFPFQDTVADNYRNLKKAIFIRKEWKIHMNYFIRICLVFALCFLRAQGQKPSLQVSFEGGHINVLILDAGTEKRFTLESTMPTTNGEATETLLSADSVSIRTSKRVRYFDNACVITSQVIKIADGLQWDIEVKGEGTAWTEPIETALKWEDAKPFRFWTSWSDNHLSQETDSWKDPLRVCPLSKTTFDLWWGKPCFQRCICDTYR